MKDLVKKGYWMAMIHSPEYQGALKLRQAYSTGHIAVVEGA
jgi:uncharacterized protein (DUF1330 family)